MRVITDIIKKKGGKKIRKKIHETNPFETAGTVEVFVPKEIIARRIQDIFVWEGYPLQKDYTWDPIENLYDQEELVETYEKWLKADKVQEG